jgi:hypothetical protein
VTAIETEVIPMPTIAAPDKLETDQVVNVIRNGVPLRCRVDFASPRCVVLRRLAACLPAVGDARAFLASCRPIEPVNDSGRVPVGGGVCELGGLSIVAIPEGGRLRAGRELFDVEIVATPRWN